jgi:hypothetical protein
MPLDERSSPEGVNGREDWLAADEWSRLRPWAYEEILFGTREQRARTQELAEVIGALEAERVELAALHESLDVHLARIAELESKLRELRGLEAIREVDESDRSSGPPPPATRPPARPRPTLPHPWPGALDGEVSHVAQNGNGATNDRREDLLTRCEGFDVEAPEGLVGFVEGLRFGSRIDCPDLLEVRGGRFGRQLLLVPVGDVDEIRLDDHCVVLRSAPMLATDLLDDLGDRLRRVFHVDHTAP